MPDGMESLDVYTFSGRSYGVSFFDQLVSRVSQLLYHLDFYVPADKVSLKQKYINRVMERYIPLYLSNYHKTRYSIDTLSTGKSVSSVTAGDDNGLMDSPWPMKCHDQRHTGCSPYSTRGHYGRIKWKFKTSFGVESSAVIDREDNIYFGEFGAILYCLQPNGTMKWSYETNGFIWSTPALAQDGTIYVTSYDAKIHALYPNGTLKWKYPAGGSITSSPAIDKDGIIYFGIMGPEYKGRVYALYPNGTMKWYYDTGYYIASDPALGDDGTIYIGSGDNYLYALYPNGTLRWRFKTGGDVKTHPVIADDGTIYFGATDGVLYAVYPNGTLRWKNSGIKVSGCSSVALDTKGIIYTGGLEIICAINPENGSIIWSYNPGKDLAMIHGSPALSSDGTLYIPICKVGDEGGWIIAVNISTGTEVWRHKVGGWRAESSPAIGSDGTIYIGGTSSNSGGLYAFGLGYPNHPPEAPVINGPTSGKPGVVYNFSVYAIDPDGDNVSFDICWDNGGDLTDFVPSGKEIILSHSWERRGEYTITIAAWDEHGACSPDTTFHIKISYLKNPLLQILKNIHTQEELWGYD